MPASHVVNFTSPSFAGCPCGAGLWRGRIARGQRAAGGFGAVNDTIPNEAINRLFAEAMDRTRGQVDLMKRVKSKLRSSDH